MTAPSHSPEQSQSGRQMSPTGRVGILLVNLGTPDATTYWPMRRYLKEFLSDRRVIEVPRLKWWPILNLAILTFRPGRKGKDYEKIWNRTLNESPLKSITRSQSEKLAAAFETGGVIVNWAMRYGNPSTGAGIASLQQRGCDRILLFPLYPQYAAATTASACDQAFRALMQLRWQPTVRVVPPYYDHPAYIDSLVASFRAHVATLDFEPEAVVASFHGMPKRNLKLGDPYYWQCHATSRLMRERIGWPEESWHTAFQSRFGGDPWLEPYTIETVTRLASEGLRRIVLIAPGFAADCLETLEELDMENRAAFKASGGEQFSCVPCLNDGPLGMSVIEHIAQQELRGWL
jgi:ferrochelatase